MDKLSITHDLADDLPTGQPEKAAMGENMRRLLVKAWSLVGQILSSQLRRNMFSGMATNAVNVALMLVSYPVYLYYLGYEKLGVWIVISTVLTFLQMCNLGMGPAITKLVAEEYGRGEKTGIQNYVSTAIWTLSATGFVALIVLVLLARPILGIFKLGPENTALAVRLLPCMGLLTVYAFVVQIFTATLSGLGRMDQVNYSDTAGRAVALGVAVVLFNCGYGLESLIAGSAASYLMMHAASLIFIRKIIKLRFLNFKWDAERFNRLLRFGGAVLGSSMVNMLFSPFNKLMLSRYAGVATVPVYEIAFNASMQVRNLIETGFRALVPEISRLSAGASIEARDRIVKIFRNSMRLIIFVGTPVFALLAVFAHLLLAFWLGGKFVEIMPLVFRIMLVGTYLSLLGAPAYYTIMGAGHIRHTFMAHLIQGFVNLALVFACLAVLGVSCQTIAVSSTIAMAFASAYLNMKYFKYSRALCG